MIKKLRDLVDENGGKILGYLSNKDLALVEYDHIVLVYEYKDDEWVVKEYE